MPVMIHINIHKGKDGDWDNEAELFLIAAFNKLPAHLTAENIPHRANRPWLISITEELNARPTKIIRNYDILDVLLKLQQMRKAGRLRNRPEMRKDLSSTPPIEVTNDPLDDTTRENWDGTHIGSVSGVD